MEAAKVKYAEAIEIDKENEYALANMGVVNLKQANYVECIQNSSDALAQIDNFQDDTASFQNNNILAVKILMRRAKCYEMTNEIEKAKNDIDKTIMLEPRNVEARELLKSIQIKLDTQLFCQFRD